MRSPEGKLIHGEQIARIGPENNLTEDSKTDDPVKLPRFSISAGENNPQCMKENKHKQSVGSQPVDAPDKAASRDGRLQKEDRLKGLFRTGLIIKEQKQPRNNEHHKRRKSKAAEAKGVRYPKVFFENKPRENVFQEVFDQSCLNSRPQ